MESLKGFQQKLRQEGLPQLDCPALCSEGAQPSSRLPEPSRAFSTVFLELNPRKGEAGSSQAHPTLET